MAFPGSPVAGCTPLSSTHVPADEGVYLVLERAGLESAPIDPSSMAALRRLVQERMLLLQPSKSAWVMASPPTASLTSYRRKKARALSPPPPLTLSEHRSCGLILEPSDLIMKSEATASIAGSNAAAGGTALDDATGTETVQLIMRQLEFQTSLLIDIQRRLDDLSTKVEQIESRHVMGSKAYPIFSAKTSSTSASSACVATKREMHDRGSNSGTSLPGVTRATLSDSEQTNSMPAVPLQQSLLRDPYVDARGWRSMLLSSVISQPFNFLRRSRVVRIVRTYWLRRHEHVQPIDGALFFRVVFMVFIIFMRLARSHQHQQKSFASKDSETGNKNSATPSEFLFQRSGAMEYLEGTSSMRGRLRKGKQSKHSHSSTSWASPSSTRACACSCVAS